MPQTRGFFNTYHKNMPFFERLLKDINHLVFSIKCILQHGRVKNVIVHPHYPSRRSTIYFTCRELGLQVTNKLKKKAVLGVYFDYATYKNDHHSLQKLADQGLKVLNIGSRNIGKNHIDEIHQQIFGYCTRIDPTKHVGKCVRKSDINALHDGIILECPIEKVEEGFIYQILIDNKNDKGLFEDIRVAIVGKEIPLVNLKYRKPEDQFGHLSTSDLVEANDVLSSEEIEKINAFTNACNFEFGELDILRDNEDGRIYIIDVNDTPNNILKEGRKEKMEILGESLHRQFLAHH